MIKCLEILNFLPNHLSHLHGDLNTGPLAPTSAVSHPKPGSVLFISEKLHIEEAINSQATLLIFDEKVCPPENNYKNSDKVIFSCKNLHACMAWINQKFFTPAHYGKNFDNQPGVHPSAHIAQSVALGKNVTIGPGACVDENCVIGENVYIGPNSVIEAGCQIGEGSHIFPLVFLGHDTIVGKNCKIQSNTSIGTDGFGYGATDKGEHIFKPHLGNVILHDNVDIGAGVFIDRGTYENSEIGEGTKIDNNCHFGHNIILGKHNLVTGGFIAAGSVTIGDHCVIGGRTTVTGHIKIASQVMLAGLSGVSKSILKPGMYGGYPLQSLKASLKTVASLPHLPDLRKVIKKLSKNI